MRLLILSVALLAVSIPVTARDRLFDAIVTVESGGNPNAVGDDGKSRGLVQASRAAWSDGCRALGVRWNYATGVRDAGKCARVFYAYTSLYGAQTPQQRARIWNGGPGGDRKKATLPYWRKVSRAMRREPNK